MKERILSLVDIEKIIQDRKAKKPKGSRVASLLASRIDRVAQKVGEEGVETALAVARLGITGEGRKEVIGEIADLWFHSLVALAASGISVAEVLGELTRRNNEKAG